MSEARVKAGLWVRAALRLGDVDGKPGAILRRGDEDAGGVLVVLRSRAGLVVLSQTRDAAGQAAWIRGTGGTPVADAAADAYVARQTSRDPDLWVLEFEAADLLPPFEGKVL